MTIYVISPKKIAQGETDTTRLVSAKNQAQALRHITDELNVTAASQYDIARLVKAGVDVEEARANPSTN